VTLDSSEPEPESRSSPYPPLEDGRAAPLSDDAQASLTKFAERYPAPITDQGKTATIWSTKTAAIWSTMNTAERDAAIEGASGYANYIVDLSRKGINRKFKDAHRWLRARQWFGYVWEKERALTSSSPYEALECSDEWVAWQVYFRCCGFASGIPTFRIRKRKDGKLVASLLRRWPPNVGSDQTVWQVVLEGAAQFSAWMQRLREMPGARVMTYQRIDDGQQFAALRVPTEWPPGLSRQPTDGQRASTGRVAELPQNEPAKRAAESSVVSYVEMARHE
jgi:hypothetical protein